MEFVRVAFLLSGGRREGFYDHVVFAVFFQEPFAGDVVSGVMEQVAYLEPFGLGLEDEFKGFRGRMVDISYRGKGLGTMINKILNEVGFGIGLRLFETVNKDNVASYRSAMSASNVKVIKELEGGDLYLEILKDKMI